MSPSASVAAAVNSTGVPTVTSPAGVRVAEAITGSAFGHGVPTFGPSTLNQSKVESTCVAAALENACTPILALAGSGVDARPTVVNVVPSVE